MSTVIIIPARMASERLPGKPLLDVLGKSLLQRTYERARETGLPVVVTSPDREIIGYCQANNILSFPSAEHHPTGTHRCAETLAWIRRKRPDISKVINWQVDEPCVEADDVVRLVEHLETDQIATMVTDDEWEAYGGKNAVKAACEGGLVYWFSRQLNEGRAHIGVYGFQVNVLAELGALSQSQLSISESLEQLAWIQYGGPIGYIEVDYLPISVNDQGDLNRLREALR